MTKVKITLIASVIVDAPTKLIAEEWLDTNKETILEDPWLFLERATVFEVHTEVMPNELVRSS